jgi:hypothetical protein
VHWSSRTKKTETRRGTGGAAEKQEGSDDQNSHHGVDLVIELSVVGKLLALPYDCSQDLFCETTDAARQGPNSIVENMLPWNNATVDYR